MNKRFDGTERVRRGPMTVEEIVALRAAEGALMDMDGEESGSYIIKAEGEKMSVAAGRVFKQARREMGLTQQEIAEVSGVKRPNIARLESGKHSPTIDMLYRVAESMGLEMEIHLVERNGNDR